MSESALLERVARSPRTNPEPCVNLRTLGSHLTGVQRYLLSLLPHLPPQLSSIKPARALSGIKGHLWEQLYLPTQLKQRLLWSPGNTGPLAVSRQVVTVHDAAALDHPEWFERKFALWYSSLLPRLIRKVRAIITVSLFSKGRIVELTGVEPERVYVIPNGVDSRFQPIDHLTVKEAMIRLGLAKPYVLFVGSLEPRKNLKMLLETWRLGNFDGAVLAVAGTSGRIFQALQVDSVPRGVHLLGRVDDDLLPALYSGAAGLVYGSIYEGFGFPPLEALACGTPAAVSDIPAHREVCGQNALYFDPFSPDDLLSKLNKILRLDRKERSSVTEEGLKRAARYRWETAAAQTWQILQQEARR